MDVGTWHEFAAPADVVKTAARASMEELRLKVVEEYRPSPPVTVFVAKAWSSGWSWGEVVRVVVEEKGPSSTSVRVISQARLTPNATAKDFAPDVVSKIASKLGR